MCTNLHKSYSDVVENNTLYIYHRSLSGAPGMPDINGEWVSRQGAGLRSPEWWWGMDLAAHYMLHLMLGRSHQLPSGQHAVRGCGGCGVQSPNPAVHRPTRAPVPLTSLPPWPPVPTPPHTLNTDMLVYNATISATGDVYQFCHFKIAWHVQCYL